MENKTIEITHAIDCNFETIVNTTAQGTWRKGLGRPAVKSEITKDGIKFYRENEVLLPFTYCPCCGVKLKDIKPVSDSEDCVTVSAHLKINGVFLNGWRKEYRRGRETYAFTLDDFARIIFIYEGFLGSGSTYAMDGLLQQAEKMLPKKGDETAQQVFEKYWLNMVETVNAEFELLNKGQGKSEKPGDFKLYPEQNDYLKFCTASLCRSFSRSALPTKYAFLYWFYKYVMNESMDEVKTEIEATPEYIKKIVDNDIVAKS